MKRSELSELLIRWAELHQDTLGYRQEFTLNIEAYDDYFSVEILEADEHHFLVGANGKTLEEACDEVVNRLPRAFANWGWPTEMPKLEDRQ